MNLERESIFEDRMEKFKDIINKFKNDQVRKIKQKSDDQSQYERAKIQNQNKQIQNQFYSKKIKNVEVQSKIRKSRKVNELRLSTMKVRFEMIKKIQNDAKTALFDSICNDITYKVLLEGLLLQGMIKMLEENLQVKCLKRDQALVKESIEGAEKKFIEMCVLESKLQVSKEFLPDSDLGGIILTSLNGRIVCNNTLKARLDYALQLSLPDIRKMLFCHYQ